MALATGKTRTIVKFINGLVMKVGTNNVNDTTPTAAEITTQFGAASNYESGWSAMINDAGGGTNVYLVATDATSWFYTKLTKAL